MRCSRRHFLGLLPGTLACRLSPVAVAVTAACSKGNWPEGMVEIKWDRDTCERCKMVISDRRFAAELRGGPKEQAFKFDDIGCAAFWMRDKAGEFSWLQDVSTRLWVADVTNKGESLRWLAAHKAHFISKTSPMGYNYGATALPQAGAVDFQTMAQHVLAKGK